MSSRRIGKGWRGSVGLRCGGAGGGGNGVPAGVFGLFEADAGEEGCGGFFWIVCKIEIHHVRSRHCSSRVPLVCSVLGRKAEI